MVGEWATADDQDDLLVGAGREERDQPGGPLGPGEETPAELHDRDRAGGEAQGFASVLTRWSRAWAQAAGEAAGPQASASEKIVPPGARTRSATLRARNSPEPAISTLAGRTCRRVGCDPVGGVGQAGEEERVGGAGELSRVVGGEVVAVETDHPGQAVAGGVEGQRLAIGGRTVEGVGGVVAQVVR